MSRSERLQGKGKVDYALLNNGLSTDAPNASSSDSVKSLETVTPMSNKPPAEPSVETEPESPQHLDDDELDAEIAELELIERGLEAKNHRRERLARRDELVRRIKKLEAVEAPEPSGRNTANSVVNSELTVGPLPVPPKLQDDVSLKDLRNLTVLNDQVDAQLSRYGLVYNDVATEAIPAIQQTVKIQGKDSINVSSPSYNTFSVPPVSNILSTVTPQSTSQKQLVSGKEARVRDSVVAPIIWPHTTLGYSYTATEVSYNTLDLSLLAAGEVSIIISASQPEQLGRLHLLRRLFYHNKDYQWSACRNFHQAVLLEVERGVRPWSNTDYHDLEAGILYKHPLPSSSSSSSTPSSSKSSSSYHPRSTSSQQSSRRFFCLDFNRNCCHHAGSHDGKIGSVTQYVEHFCATCWRKDHEAREHRESASTCPHRK